jgi:hypothetical protein
MHRLGHHHHVGSRTARHDTVRLRTVGNAKPAGLQCGWMLVWLLQPPYDRHSLSGRQSAARSCVRLRGAGGGDATGGSSVPAAPVHTDVNVGKEDSPPWECAEYRSLTQAPADLNVALGSRHCDIAMAIVAVAAFHPALNAYAACVDQCFMPCAGSSRICQSFLKPS